ncbi:MAG: 50S ribosomal protein L9 [Endomicrobiia bacterium]
MKVILKQDLEKVGKVGEIKDVKPGFARNYLFPKGFAVLATEENLNILKLEKEKLEKAKKIELKNVKEMADKLGKLSLNINVKVGESGKMFGTVTKEDIMELIKKETGFDLEKQDVLLEEPIKETGIYNVEIKMRSKKFPEDIFEIARVKVWVVGEN